MKVYDVNKVKNIALAGHNGSGKTSLAEALLFKAGATDLSVRPPTVLPSATMTPKR